MTKIERQATITLSLILTLRMFGLFMVLPIFSLYAKDLIHATPFLIGIAAGIYGLTQGLLQLPFGMLSDYVGRKPIIFIGLCLLIIGSIIAAEATTIENMILGRALQGAGAIGSSLIALLSDLTSEQQRTKSMAIMGITIGLAFYLAMLGGPILNIWLQVSGLFWLTAFFALINIILLLILVPKAPNVSSPLNFSNAARSFLSLLTAKNLIPYYAGIFILHVILTASFVILPITLKNFAGLSQEHQWYVYFPSLLLACFAFIPLLMRAEKNQKQYAANAEHLKSIFLLTIGLLIISQLLLSYYYTSAITTGLLLFIFFTGFNFLEASLPSLVSKIAPATHRGTAMGIFSTAQFLGIFIGGTLGGIFYQYHHPSSVFFSMAILGCIWWFITKRTASSINSTIQFSNT